MSRRNCLLCAAVSFPLLLAGCGLIVNPDVAEPNEPLPSTVVIVTNWDQGGGFLVDRVERLIVTSHRVVETSKKVEVAFPAMEEGKAVVKREFYMDPNRHVPARIVGASPEYDLAILQVDSLPTDLREMKLADGSVPAGSSVRFVGDVHTGSLWGLQTASVNRVAPLNLAYGNGPKITAPVLELQAPADLGKASRGSPVLNEAGQVVAVIGGGDNALLTAIDVNTTRNFLGTAYRYLGNAAFEHRDFPLALSHCDKALALNPNDAIAHNDRGAALSQLDRWDDAVAAYSAAIKADPKLALAYRNRGSAHLHQGKVNECIADCTAAIRIDPNYARAYETRRLAYARLDKMKEASADEKQAMALNQVSWQATEPFSAKWFPATPMYRPYATGQYESQPFPSTGPQPDRSYFGSSMRGGGQRPWN